MNAPRAARHAGARNLVVIVCLLLCGATSEARENVAVSVDGDLIAVTASEAPLREVLEEVAVRCDLELVTSNDLARRVTLNGGAMPVEELLRRLLREESYLLLGSDTDDIRGLWIFPDGDEGTGEVLVFSKRQQELDRAIVAMSDPDAEVREEAVLSLGDIEGADIEPLLAQALSDSDATVREAASALLEVRGQ